MKASPEAYCELTAIMIPLAKAWCEKEEPDTLMQRVMMMDEAGITPVEMMAGLFGIIDIMQMKIQQLFGDNIDFIFEKTGEVNQMFWDLAREDGNE